MWVSPPPPLHTVLPCPTQPARVQGIEEGPPSPWNREWGGCVRAGCLQFQPVAEAGGAQLGEGQLAQRKRCDG